MPHIYNNILQNKRRLTVLKLRCKRNPADTDLKTFWGIYHKFNNYHAKHILPFKNILLSYLAALGLNCVTGDLPRSMPGLLCGLLWLWHWCSVVAVRGFSSWGTQGSLHRACGILVPLLILCLRCWFEYEFLITVFYVEHVFIMYPHFNKI